MTEARRAVRKALPSYGRVVEMLRSTQPSTARAIEAYVSALRAEAAESRAYIRTLQQQIDEQAQPLAHLPSTGPVAARPPQHEGVTR